MHPLAPYSPTTLHVVNAFGELGRFHPTYSFQTAEIAWTSERSTELSIWYLGRLACVAPPTAMGRVSTICDIDSPLKHCCGGTRLAKMLSAACLSCPHIWVMSTLRTP